MKLKREFNIPNLFDFDQTREIEDSKISKLIPSWMSQKK